MNDTSTSNTKIESSFNNSNGTNNAKVTNFLRALNELKGEKKSSGVIEGLYFNKTIIQKQKQAPNNFPTEINVFSSNSSNKSSRNNYIHLTENITTEYDKNINENSVVNVNCSIEENVSMRKDENVNYLNNPVEKNMEIVNNSIKIRKKKKKLSGRSASSTNPTANFPYKMDIIIKPFLRNQEKIVEAEFEDTDSEGDDKIGNCKENVIKPGLVYSKNKCSTAYDSNNGSHNKEMLKLGIERIERIEKKAIVIPKSVVIPVMNVIFDKELDDLDEVKEINMMDYKFDGNSSGVCRRLNISDLDVLNLDINFDASRCGGDSFIIGRDNNKRRNRDNKHKRQNKNSKILIVDSVSNSGDLSQNLQANNNHNNSGINNNLNSSHNFLHINSGCFNIRNINFLSNKYQSGETGLNSTQKKMRRKYFKSEIFESHNRKFPSNINTNNNSKTNTNNNSIIVGRKRGITSTTQNKPVNKNLLKIFNEAGLEMSVELEEELVDIERIDLATEFENTSIVNTCEVVTENNTDRFEVDVDAVDEYETPRSKIRTQNTINDITVLIKKQRNMIMNVSNPIVTEEGYTEMESYVDTVFDLEFINNLLIKEHYYRVDPGYILRHPKLEIVFRSVLIEWLMELCEEFAFKRDTFHYAVNYLDRFLAKTMDISKRSLQLIGVTCLSIAAKCEEIQIPKIEDYINSTDNCYTNDEFISAEKHILLILKWEIMPITTNTWLNWYLCQWDLYMDTLPYIKEKLAGNNREPIFFKKADEQSYIYYRQITQLIDLYTVDYFSLEHIPRYLIAASLFIVVARVLKFEAFLPFNIHKFDFDADFYMAVLMQKEHFIIEIFSDFLQQSFNFSISDCNFIEALVYCSKFLDFEYNYNIPLVIQGNDEGMENGNYEDFLSYQTHNEKNFEFLEKIVHQSGIKPALTEENLEQMPDYKTKRLKA